MLQQGEVCASTTKPSAAAAMAFITSLACGVLIYYDYKALRSPVSRVAWMESVRRTWEGERQRQTET